MRANRLKDLCQKRKPAFGSFLTINAPLVAETMAGVGYDFFFVDLQHGLIGPDGAANVLTAISTTDATPIVRVARNDSALIMQAADFGAYGVVCPLVNSREEAEQFVAALRYPPQGIRSFGPVRGAIYGGSDYASKANGTLLSIAMIETRKGLENLDDILNTTGLDAILVGPNDLSLSLTGQVSSNSQDPEVQKAFTHIAQAANAKGVFPGIHCTDAVMARDMVSRGYRFCSISGDQSLLAKAAVASLGAVRQEG